MAAPDMQLAGLQNVFLPALLQSFLSEICSRAVQALAHLEDSSSNSMMTCVHHPADTRPGDISSKLTEECTARRLASNFDEENDSSEKCRVSMLDKVAAPDRADRAPRQQFSDWLLVAKNKDDEDDDDDEEDDDEDDDDEEGDDEEGDDEEGGDAEGEEGDGDEDEEEDEADEDDEEDEDEDEDEDDDEEDESPPKKLRK